KLLPSAVLPVGTTDAVKREETAPGVEFLVPPNPAMYDEEAADTERQTILARHAQRQKQLAALSTAIGDDAALEWKLTTGREDYPPGAVATLAEEAETAATELAESQTAVVTAEHLLAEAAARRARLRETIPVLRIEARTGDERARKLGELAGRA